MSAKNIVLPALRSTQDGDALHRWRLAVTSAVNQTNSNSILALQVAEAAYKQANTASNIAEAAYAQANAAYAQANTVINVAPAYDKANAAYDQANLANVLAQTSLVYANTGLGYVYLNNTLAQSAYVIARQANITANAIVNGTINLVSLNVTNNITVGNSDVLGIENVNTLNVSSSIADMGFLLVRGQLPAIQTMNSQAGGITLGSQQTSGITQAIEMFAANSGTDNGWWEIIATNNSPQFIMRTANDTYNNISNFLRVTRANSNIVSVIVGNPQDLPQINLDGNVAILGNLSVVNVAVTLANVVTLNVSGQANILDANIALLNVVNVLNISPGGAIVDNGWLGVRGVLPGTAAINVGGVVIGNQAAGNTQCIEIFTENSGLDNGWWEVVATNNNILQFRTANDTYGNVVTWLRVARAKTNITSIQIGDIIDAPKTTFLGNVTIQRPSGAGLGLQDLSITDGTHTALFGSNTTQGAWNPLGAANDTILMAANGVINTAVLTLIPWAANASGIRISNNNITMISDAGQGVLNVNAATVNINAALVMLSSNVTTENVGTLNVRTSIVDQGWLQVQGNFPATANMNLASGAITVGSENSGNVQGIEFFVANSGVDQGWWEVVATNTQHFIMRTANDTYGNIANWLIASRTNSNITSIALGNNFDLPTITLLGNVSVAGNTSLTNLSLTAITNQLVLKFSFPTLTWFSNTVTNPNTGRWFTQVENNGLWELGAEYDDQSNVALAMSISRVNSNISVINLGNQQDLPGINFFASAAQIKSPFGQLILTSTNTPANTGLWTEFVDSVGTFWIQARNDGQTNTGPVFAASRVSGGSNISAITIGNKQDNPPILLNGNLHINAAATTGQPLTIDCYANTQGLQINNTSNTVGGGIQWSNALSQRWSIATSHTPETGGNVGTDLGFFSYSDTGSFIGEPITITRATGNVIFSGNISVSANLTAGNATLANANVSGTANLVNLLSPNTTTYANGGLIVASANQNFNNTATINVGITANGTQANIAFNANLTAIVGPTANVSNTALALAVQVNSIAWSAYALANVANNTANAALSFGYLTNTIAEAAYVKANAIPYSNGTLTLTGNINAANATVNGVSFIPVWTAPTVNASYTTVTGYNPAGYWRDPFGIVHLRGTLKPTTNTLVSAALNVNVCNGFPLATANNILECLGANDTVLGTNTTTMFQAVLYTNGAIQLTGDISPVAGNLVFFSLDGETYSNIG